MKVIRPEIEIMEILDVVTASTDAPTTTTAQRVVEFPDDNF